MMHGFNPPKRFLPYLSWTEIAALPDKANTVIVLPCGSTEQHGPHLPCAVDTVICSGVVGLPGSMPAKTRTVSASMRWLPATSTRLKTAVPWAETVPGGATASARPNRIAMTGINRANPRCP